MQFNKINIERCEVIQAARSYRGMRYDANHNLEAICADCAGFMLMVIARVKLLDSAEVQGDRAQFLAALLHENFVEIDINKAIPGDLLRFNFDNSDGRHIAIMSDFNPAPHGSIIHCMNGRVTNNGAVIEQRIDARMAKYLFRAYRLNQWVQ